MKQYKFYGPRGAVLSRVFTDNDELISLADKSNHIVIPDEEKHEEDNAPKNEETESKELSV